MSDDLKVVQVSPTYIGDLMGGGERYPWELSKALSTHLKTCLIVFGNERHTEAVTDTLIIEKYPAKISPGPLFTKTNPFPLTRSFLNKIDEADIVHIHQFNTLVSNLLIYYAHAKEKIVCLTDHGGGYFKLAEFLPIVGGFVDTYMSVSKFSSTSFNKYNKRMDLIYGGVDTTIFYPRDLEKTQILCVGKILKVKGIDVLIQAIQGLSVTLKIDARLLDTDYLDLLVKLDKHNHAVFSFNATDGDLLSDYNHALATVIPSLSETLSLVALESMACGTPVICSNVGGMREIVEDGKNGFLIPPGDQKKLRECIGYFIDNPSESRKMGERARKIVLNYYTWDAVANRCIKCYRDLKLDGCSSGQ